MRLLRQTKLSSHNKNGNCFATCIANILGFDIEDVPNVETLFGVVGDNIGFYMFVMLKWLDSIGYQYFEIQPDEWVEDEIYIASGMTNRGTMHSVLYKNGELYFDVHPSDDGLTEIKFFTIIRQMNL